MDDEEFRGPLRAYVQTQDLGRFVDGRVTDSGDWKIYYRDHTGRLQQLVVPDDVVRKHVPPVEGPEADECSSCKTTHVAEESPVVYEAPTSAAAGEIDVASSKKLRWHRTKTGYEAKGCGGAYKIKRRKSDRRHGVRPIVLETGTAAYQFDTIEAAKDYAQSHERVRGASETPRPKAGEGGGAKTVSRWVHWQAIQGGREYTGRGQLTGGTYRVVLRKGRKRPQWFLLTPAAGLGTPFLDADQAMLFADKIEAEAKGVPHGAEKPAARETAAPLVTLKRNFKQYLECTKLSGVVNRPSAIWKLLGKSLNAEAQEVFVVIPKNIHAKLSDCPVEVARGARDHVEVDPSIVLQAALASNADSFSVVHNHPGSRGDPSRGDIDLTATLEKAAKALDSVKFDEHYIVSAKGVYAIRAKKFWRA